MDAFMDAYYAIDVDHSGTITTDELREYMKKNDMDEQFINRWQELFDPDSTGEITLENFRDVLGLETPAVQPIENHQLAEKPLGIDYEVLAADLPEDLQREFVVTCKEGEHEFGDDDSKLVKWIKLELDKKYGRLWHCTLVRGRYSSYYSYQQGHSFVFKMNKRIFIIFKTPST